MRVLVQPISEPVTWLSQDSVLLFYSDFIVHKKGPYATLEGLKMVLVLQEVQLCSVKESQLPLKSSEEVLIKLAYDIDIIMSSCG